MKFQKYTATWVFLAFVLVFAILLCALPQKEFSENEKRFLATFPELSVESVKNNTLSSELDTWASDQFPFRDFFVGVHSYSRLLLGLGGNSGVYACDDGYLVAAPAMIDEARCQRNVARLASFAKAQELPATLLIVPSAGSTMEDKLPFAHEDYPDDTIYSIAEQAKGDLSMPDLRAIFEDGEGYYYRTDHHLTTTGSYQMYLAYCEAVGLEPITDYPHKESLTDFYGTNYSKSGLWLTEPDDVEIWHPADESGITVTIDDLNGEETYDSLYFYEHDEAMDKYPVFLDGNHAIVTIENERCTNGKRLLVVKDSFAHCFSTFLCQQYESICLVDLRYYRGGVSTLIEEQGVNELLFLFGSDNLAGLAELALLR